jgi:hypothetical protein
MAAAQIQAQAFESADKFNAETQPGISLYALLVACFSPPQRNLGTTASH